MNIEAVSKILDNASGMHLEKIYIPSLQQYAFFYPLTTAHVKTLTRINFLDKFDLSIELLKLSLFDKLSAETLSDRGLTANTITIFDYLSFLIGIRQLLKNDITFSFKCKNCQNKFQKTIDLSVEFDSIIQQFRPQHEEFIKIDQETNNIWKFELTNFSMSSYLYYKFVLQQLAEKTKNNPDVMNQQRFMKPILYIKNIYLNDQLITDWPEAPFPQKLALYNKISPNVTINETPTNNSLYGFIHKTFAQEKLQQKIKEMTVTCDSCGKNYRGVYRLDNFFTFQGLRTTI